MLSFRFFMPGSFKAVELHSGCVGFVRLRTGKKYY